LFESKVHDEIEKQNMEKVDSEAIKSKYDRRIYELDVYKTVLQKIDGYDYRYPKGSIDQEDSLSTQGSESETLEKEIGPQQVRTLEQILSKKCKKC
jgi:hypothetical protein